MLPVVIDGIARNSKHNDRDYRYNDMRPVQAEEPFPLAGRSGELTVFSQTLLLRLLNLLLVQSIENELKRLEILLRCRAFLIRCFDFRRLISRSKRLLISSLDTFSDKPNLS